MHSARLRTAVSNRAACTPRSDGDGWRMRARTVIVSTRHRGHAAGMHTRDASCSVAPYGLTTARLCGSVRLCPGRQRKGPRASCAISAQGACVDASPALIVAPLSRTASPCFAARRVCAARCCMACCALLPSIFWAFPLGKHAVRWRASVTPARARQQMRAHCPFARARPREVTEARRTRPLGIRPPNEVADRRAGESPSSALLRARARAGAPSS